MFSCSHPKYPALFSLCRHIPESHLPTGPFDDVLRRSTPLRLKSTTNFLLSLEIRPTSISPTVHQGWSLRPKEYGKKGGMSLPKLACI